MDEKVLVVFLARLEEGSRQFQITKNTEWLEQVQRSRGSIKEGFKQLQKDYDHLKESFKFQTDLAVKGWETVIELQRENEQLKNPQIWTNDGDL